MAFVRLLALPRRLFPLFFALLLVAVVRFFAFSLVPICALLVSFQDISDVKVCVPVTTRLHSRRTRRKRHGLSSISLRRELKLSRVEVAVKDLPKPTEGVFSNTMAYVRWGDGPKTLLVIPGGPGNGPPSGGQVRMMMSRSLRPLLEDGYSLWMVARRRGMPPGYTIEDMAADYADLIEVEFDGSVDLVVGISYGGAVGQYLAANHSDRFDHIALVGCAYTFSDDGRRLDLDFASALSEGERSKAGRLMADAMLAHSRWRWAAPVLGTLIGLIPSPTHDRFTSDVMVEAEAEMALDARPVVSRIPGPVLLVGGDKDFYVPVPLIEETAQLIPDCTLVVYAGKGHAGAITNRRLAPDILEHIGNNPRAVR